jgi:hypothetical protein
MNRLVKLAEEQLSNARNNLARARAAAQVVDPTKEWGHSGRTLAEVIAGYEDWEREALVTLSQARAVTEGAK